MQKSIYRSRREQLHRAMVYVKAERILDRPLHDRFCISLRPIARLSQELVNDLQIEALRIG
jgi:hypothetical protein